MAWYNYLNPSNWGKKSSHLFAEVVGGQVIIFDANGRAFIKNGYDQNPQVFAVIKRISAKFSAGFYKVFDDTKEREQVLDHPLPKMLKRPNPLTGRGQFYEQLAGYYLVTGETIVHAPLMSGGDNAGVPTQMWVIPSPLLRDITFDKIGRPLEYIFQTGRGEKKIPANEIMYWADTNLKEPKRGMSKLTALRTVVSQSNAGYEANAKILQNSGAKGILSVAEPGSSPSPETLSQMEANFYDKYTGPHNHGKIVIAGQKMSWEQIGLSAVDMDILNAQKMNLRDICNVYGTHSQLFNDPDNKTFANMKEAKKDFVDSNIVPMMNSFIGQMEVSLVKLYEEKDNKIYTIEVDRSVFPELEIDFNSRADALATSWWIEPNRKRELMGEERLDIPEMDMVWMPSTLLPIDFSTPDATDKAIQAALDEHLK